MSWVATRRCYAQCQGLDREGMGRGRLAKMESDTEDHAPLLPVLSCNKDTAAEKYNDMASQASGRHACQCIA